MELDAQEVTLLSEVVHERLERARRRSKKVRKKDRLAHHQLIHQLGNMLHRLDAVRVLDVEKMAHGMLDEVREGLERDETAGIDSGFTIHSTPATMP